MNYLYSILFVFFVQTAFAAADSNLSSLMSECIEQYDQALKKGGRYPIVFSKYEEGRCENNVIRLLKSLNDDEKDKPIMLMIERIDEQGRNLPFLAKNSRHYDFDKRCLRPLHFLNQKNWPYSLVVLSQFALYLSGNHSWFNHFVILHRDKIYDVDTRSNGVNKRDYFVENFLHDKHPELMSQYKISVFYSIGEYSDFLRILHFVKESVGNKIVIEGDNLKLPLNKFLDATLER